MPYLKVLLPIVMLCSAQASSCQRHREKPERFSLISAVKKGSLRKVKKCLDENEDPNVTDSNGNTPLHWACCYDTKGAIIQLLLDKGAHIDAQDLDGRTPLEVAVKQQNTSAIEQLLKLQPGAHIAAQNAAGANVHVQNSDGLTPLHSAVNRQDITAVKMLLEAGASPNSKDYKGNTPLWYACCPTGSRSPSEEIMMLLLAYRPDVHIRYQNGLTLLHCSAALNWDKVVQRLLALQVDPNVKDDNGLTPLRYAKGRDVLLPLLLHSNS